jgi:hypothetical protein
VHTEGGGYENGHVLSAKFKNPISICVGPDDSIYVIDNWNPCIRKISGDEVSTVAGQPGKSFGYLNGAGNEAQFGYLYDIDIDDDGNLYVVDSCMIRKIDPSGNVTTVTGDRRERDHIDGDLMSARFEDPCGLCIDGKGNILVADFSSVRYIDFASNAVSTLTRHEESDLSQDDINNPRLQQCYSICLDLHGNIIVTDWIYIEEDEDEGIEAQNIYRMIIIPSHTGGISSHFRKLSQALSPINKLNQLQEDFKNMLSKAALFESDVTFKVKDEKNEDVLIPAHRSILMARSEYFRTMFGSGMWESNKSSGVALNVGETTPVAFKSLLVYLYTGDLVDVVSGDVVIGLIELAHRYDLKDLENYCLWFLETNMKEDTAISLLLWLYAKADQGLYLCLQGKIKSYVLNNLKSIRDNYGSTLRLLHPYPELMQEILTELI